MPKIVDHESYRLELLSQCFHLFARHGYGNVSMRQIADELGVSTGTLYHYFSNKKAIFEQTFLVLSQQDISQLTVKISETTSLEERLDVLSRFIRENEPEILNYILLTFDFYRLREPGEDDDFIKKSVTDYREALIELSGLPPDLASLVYSALDGLIMQRFLTPEQVDLDAQLSLLQEMIMNQVEQS